jgi:hypothetical protein
MSIDELGSGTHLDDICLNIIEDILKYLEVLVIKFTISCTWVCVALNIRVVSCNYRRILPLASVVKYKYYY